MVLFACPAWAGQYVDNRDGTVTDTSTGLMWQQATAPGTYTWDQAISYCGSLSLAGYTDWWLPTIDELKSLVDTRYRPTIDPTYFPDTAASWYWSSTTHVSNTNYAWNVYFDFGYVSYPNKNYAGYVRAVRGGQSGLFGNLVISPVSRDMTKDAGTTTFSVSNTGTGTMPWSASVISGSWLTITSGASGTDSGTIYCSFTANTSTSARTATIHVTATGATGSPVDVTVTQAPTPVQLVLSVTPSKQAVSNDVGATTFSVSNTGTGDMQWTAAVTSGGSWLAISSGASGTNSGTITCNFTANTSSSARTATIRVTATGATGSPVDVTVTQPTGCTATLDGNLMLHISVLSYLNPSWGAPSFWAYFVYEYNPTYPALIIFKMTNAGIITASTYSCKTSETSTLSDDLKIHIPNVLLADGITLLSVDMEYIPVLSTDGNTYFVVTKYGVVPN